MLDWAFLAFRAKRRIFDAEKGKLDRLVGELTFEECFQLCRLRTSRVCTKVEKACKSVSAVGEGVQDHTFCMGYEDRLLLACFFLKLGSPTLRSCFKVVIDTLDRRRRTKLYKASFEVSKKWLYSEGMILRRRTSMMRNDGGDQMAFCWTWKGQLVGINCLDRVWAHCSHLKMGRLLIPPRNFLNQQQISMGMLLWIFIVLLILITSQKKYE